MSQLATDWLTVWVTERLTEWLQDLLELLSQLKPIWELTGDRCDEYRLNGLGIIEGAICLVLTVVSRALSCLIILVSLCPHLYCTVFIVQYNLMIAASHHSCSICLQSPLTRPSISNRLATLLVSHILLVWIQYYFQKYFNLGWGKTTSNIETGTKSKIVKITADYKMGPRIILTVMWRKSKSRKYSSPFIMKLCLIGWLRSWNRFGGGGWFGVVICCAVQNVHTLGKMSIFSIKYFWNHIIFYDFFFGEGFLSVSPLFCVYQKEYFYLIILL